MMSDSICSKQADYSKVSGDRILPFIFSLNMEDSVLYPTEGEYQKFCYDIEAVGEDTSKYADLSHFLFGIYTVNDTETRFFNFLCHKTKKNLSYARS